MEDVRFTESSQVAKRPKPPKAEEPKYPDLFDSAPLGRKPEPERYEPPPRTPPPFWKRVLGPLRRLVWKAWAWARLILAHRTELGLLIALALFLLGITQCDFNLGPYRVKVEGLPLLADKPAAQEAKDPWHAKVRPEPEE